MFITQKQSVWSEKGLMFITQKQSVWSEKGLMFITQKQTCIVCLEPERAHVYNTETDMYCLFGARKGSCL